jgi:ABC-type nitrate/sulfonate/bicarbonate transport system substrate-binding protein
MKNRFLKLTVVVLLLAFGSFCFLFAGGKKEEMPEEAAVEGMPEIPTIPQVEVSFGHEPYLDHTQGIIGMEKGWFKDVGITITPEPAGKVISNEAFIGVLSAGTLDVMSGSAVLVLPAIKETPPYKAFVHGDMFQGYALMAQPDDGYKTVQDFIDEGVPPKEALGKAVGQMRGKRFAYPPEAAIKGFIFLCLEKAGMTLDDVESIVAEDAKTWAMMIGDQADFQVGGVPSRITLESKGFLPVITSGDLAQYADASADASELRAVFQDGWMALDSWIEDNYDTMLRMSSVMFRITKYMNTNQAESIAIHLPFLNSAAGTQITPEECVVVYESLDPFLTFEDQKVWYLEMDNPLYIGYVTGSHIKMWEEKELFKPGEVKVSDVDLSERVYNEFLEMRADSDSLMAEAKGFIADGEADGKDVGQAKELYGRAQFFYDAYDFLDSKRFAAAAIEWANYAMSQ